MFTCNFTIYVGVYCKVLKKNRLGVMKMERIFHPVSGESGYFTTEQEKVLIDAIIHDYNNQLVVTSADGRGGVNE